MECNVKVKRFDPKQLNQLVFLLDIQLRFSYIQLTPPNELLLKTKERGKLRRLEKESRRGSPSDWEGDGVQPFGARLL